MKKVVFALLAGLFLLPQALPVFAVDVNLNGEFRVRGFLEGNLTDANKDGRTNDEAAFNDARFRLKTTISAGITEGIVLLDFINGFAGNDLATVQTFRGISGTVGTGDSRFGEVGFGSSRNVVGVREAYLKVKLPLMDVLKLNLLAGRQPIKLGEGITLDDTADAIAGNFVLADIINVTLGDIKLCDTQASQGGLTGCGAAGGGSGGNGGDTDIFFGSAGVNVPPDIVFNMFGTYTWDRGPTAFRAILGGDDKVYLYTAGFQVATDLFAPFNFRMEGDWLEGRAQSSLGGARLHGMNAMAGLDAPVGPFTVGLMGVWATGQDGSRYANNKFNINELSGNFQLGNILLNNTEVSDRDGGSVGWGRERGTVSSIQALTNTNNGTCVAGSQASGENCVPGAGIIAVKGSFGMSPMPKTTMDMAVIWARAQDRPLVASNVVVHTASKTIGYEIDANAHYKFDSNLTLNLGIGYLIPKGYYKSVYDDPNADSPIYKVHTALVYSF